MWEKTSETILRYNMFDPEARLGVAVSGGPDSTALLRVLLEIAGAWRLRLHVLHLNHCLRGAESDADAAFVKKLAKDLGLPVTVVRDDPRSRGGNLEQESRRARARFFESARREFGLARIATGHTLSDQAETVLFRLLRGSSTAGLAGILPVTAEGLVRPLIDAARGEVLSYLKEIGQPYRVDSSNEDFNFRRNLIRHGLIPQLVREWNPEIETALATTARLAYDEERYWSGLMKRWFAKHAQTHIRGVVLDGTFRSAPTALARRIMREAIRRVRGTLAGIDFEHVEAAVAEEPGRVSLPGVEVWAWRETTFVGLPAPRDEIRLEPPCQVPELGVRLGLPVNGYTKDGHWLAGSKLGGPLILRTWRAGDAYCPTGCAKVRKLKDLLQKARVPSWDRAGWPIILMDGRIVWAMRFGPAAGFEADPETPGALGVFGNLVGE